MQKEWYKIKNSTSEVSDVYLFNDIGTFGVTAQSFIDEIKEYENQELNIHINSLGGEVFEGMAIYSIIQRRKAKTTVYIEGIAASIASVIALAADEVIMSENSLIMIHNAWGGTQGDAKDMRKQADVLDKITNEIAEVYVKKTRIPYNEIIEMMNEETWLTAEEAVALGFVDSISEPIKVAAKYDVSKFKNITNKKMETILSLTNKKKIKMTEELKSWFNSKVDEIIAKVKDSDETAETAESVKVEVKLADNEEIMNKISEFEATISTLNNSVADLEGEKETLTEEVSRLTALVNKSEAVGTEVKTEGDPTIIAKEEVLDENALFFNGVADALKHTFVR
jgi:ATP-dependent Clp endopeptidase proteolytic subunit ClpP